MGDKEWELKQTAEKNCDCYRPVDAQTLQVSLPDPSRVIHATPPDPTTVSPYCNAACLPCSGWVR